MSWPVAILIVALLYRRPLTQLVTGNLTRLRAGPFELAWDQAKSGTSRTLQPRRLSSVDALASPRESPTSLLGEEVVALAESNPREAILRAYEAVRTAISRALTQADVEPDSNAADALALIRQAESAGITPPATTDAVLGLNVLHNLAVHAPSHEPSAARAHEYLAMADGALYSLAMALKTHLAGKAAA